MDDVFGHFDLVLKAFLLTIELLVVSGAVALVLGTILGAFRVGPVPVLRWVGAVYVTVFRNTPLLIIFIFVFFALPKLGVDFSFFVKACVPLSVYTAAFVCEALRSGINSVPVGQAEAARAIGMTFTKTMTQVVLPQAFRAVVPPMVSVLIALAKNTSVAAGFGLMEATARMADFSRDNPATRPWIFLTFAIGYIIIVEVLSGSGFALERRWRVAR